MRFRNLGQEATQGLWGKWKTSILEILDEFNSDVLGGKGSVHENKFGGKPCVLLETKKESLCVSPYSGFVLAFGLYHRVTPEDKPRKKPVVFAPKEEDLIFWTGLDIARLESRRRTNKTTQLYYLEKALKRVYRMHWMRV